MPKPSSFGHRAVEVSARISPIQGMPRQDVPLRIAILGDFSARANRPWSAPLPKLRDQRPARLDRDNINQVLKKAGIELKLPVAGPGNPAVRIRLTELDDFHPDRLLQQVEVFQELRGLRTRLSNTSTFAAAAAEIAGWASTTTSGSPQPSRVATPPQTPGPPPVTLDNRLEQVLKESRQQPQAAGERRGSADWQALIHEIVEPHLVPAIDSGQQTELLARVDEAVGRHMRAILHHPDFQAVEAAWRGGDFLLRRLATDADLQVFLLDLSKAELACDLASADDLYSTGVYRLLVDEAASQPWGILAGLYTFDQSRNDVELLGRLAWIARQSGAPFLAGGSCQLVGCASLAQTPDPDDWRLAWSQEDEEAWAALRRLPEAPYLGLALPRFLLRLPYGQESALTESFHFEEMPEGSPHEAYLWGHPAILCVCLMAQAFSQFGWSFRPGIRDEVDGLPLHIHYEAGEGQIKPCAEVVLGGRAVERILDRGLMPLLSLPGRDVIRVPCFQSLAERTTSLAGRWS